MSSHLSLHRLQEVDTSIHLLITAAALTDAGGYECVAIVDNTTINKTFYLQVNGALKINEVSIYACLLLFNSCRGSSVDGGCSEYHCSCWRYHKAPVYSLY